MNIFNTIRWTFLIASFGVLYAGNANAYLINLDATKNGVSQMLSAGTYEIVPVSAKFDAWTAWDLSKAKDPVCSDANGCDRTSAKILGWLNTFSFESSDLVNVKINGAPALPDVGDRYTVNQFMAFPDAVSALAHAWSAEFTLTDAGIVKFLIPDGSRSDNDGGMSLHVVPEPSILALMALGLVGIGYSRRKSV